MLWFQDGFALIDPSFAEHVCYLLNCLNSCLNLWKMPSHKLGHCKYGDEDLESGEFVLSESHTKHMHELTIQYDGFKHNVRSNGGHALIGLVMIFCRSKVRKLHSVAQVSACHESSSHVPHAISFYRARSRLCKFFHSQLFDFLYYFDHLDCYFFQDFC